MLSLVAIDSEGTLGTPWRKSLRYIVTPQFSDNSVSTKPEPVRSNSYAERQHLTLPAMINVSVLQNLICDFSKIVFT